MKTKLLANRCMDLEISDLEQLKKAKGVMYKEYLAYLVLGCPDRNQFQGIKEQLENESLIGQDIYQQHANSCST